MSDRQPIPNINIGQVYDQRYSDAEVHTLRFIKRSRELGFSMPEIAELVSLWQNRRRASESVRCIAQKHADELAQRIAAMQAMQQTLGHQIHCCHGDARPEVVGSRRLGRGLEFIRHQNR